MKVVIREDVVHAGCGGKVRERVHQDFERAIDGINKAFGEGLCTYEQFLQRLEEISRLEDLAAAKPDKERDLECLYCGEDTAQFGTEENPMRAYIKTAPAAAYNGRIINPRD